MFSADSPAKREELSEREEEVSFVINRQSPYAIKNKNQSIFTGWSLREVNEGFAVPVLSHKATPQPLLQHKH